MVAGGLAPSRSRARDMILRETVRVDGATVSRPSQRVGADAALTVDDPGQHYVSRAALKLVAGLDTFGFSPEGLSMLDLGASTGGFTQVLLERGAQSVVAVDVGHDQMHPLIAGDPRVLVKDGINARALVAEDLEDHPVQALVSDVSFISLKLVLPPALAMAKPGAWAVLLVKPQFEVGRDGVGKGGIVRDPAAGEAALAEMARWIGEEQGWRVVGTAPSPISGGDGNNEYLLGAVNA